MQLAGALCRTCTSTTLLLALGCGSTDSDSGGTNGTGGNGNDPCGLGAGPVELASGQASPTAVVVGSNKIYWLNGDVSGAVMAVDKCGGTPEVLATAQQPFFLVVDAESAYWAEQGGAEASVRKVSLGGGESTLLATKRATRLALATDRVFATAHNDDEIWSVPKAGGSVTVELKAPEVSFPSGIVVSGDTLFWINRLNATMQRWPIGGTPESFTFWIGDNTMELTSDEKNLYWPSHSSGDLYAIPKEGGENVTLANLQTGELASDGTHLYTVGFDQIARVPVTGGTPQILATDESGASSVAVDESRVYWTNTAAGTVMTLTK